MTDVPPWMRKRPAAIKAVDDHVEDGMIVGIGTGNAACMAADRLAELVRDGFDLGFVSASEQTTAYARGLGLEALDIDCVESIDVTIDGADEVGPHLDLIKGLGGALLIKKIISCMTEKEVIVVPTATVPQGISAMMCVDTEEPDPQNILQAMTDAAANVTTAQITYAARNSDFDGFAINEGDYLALCDGKLLGTDRSLDVLLERLAQLAVEKSAEFITVYAGEGVSDEDADRAAQLFQTACPDAEVSALPGGQPVYYYIVAIE